MRFAVIRQNLGNPRAPTTTLPDARLDVPISEHQRYISQRPVDRGAMVPVNGVRQVMPDGSLGGIPKKPRNLFEPLSREPFPKVSLGQAKALTLAHEQEHAAALLASKPRITIVRGRSALYEAKAGPLRIDPRSGRALYRSGIVDDIRKPSQRGQFAQQRVTPKSTLDRMVWGRLQRVPQDTDPSTVRRDYRGQRRIEPEPVGAGSISRIEKGAMPGLFNSSDVGQQPVRKAPDNGNPSIDTGERIERLMFLVGAIAIGWFALTKLKAA